MDLEKAKKNVQLLKSRAACADLELKVMERRADIERIEDHIEKQKQLIEELERELKE